MKSNNIQKYADCISIIKGGKYEVISMAKHTETGEDLVVYKSVHFGSVYARPLYQWFEKVFVETETEREEFSRFEEINW